MIIEDTRVPGVGLGFGAGGGVILVRCSLLGGGFTGQGRTAREAVADLAAKSPCRRLAASFRAFLRAYPQETLVSLCEARMKASPEEFAPPFGPG